MGAHTLISNKGEAVAKASPWATGVRCKACPCAKRITDQFEKGLLMTQNASAEPTFIYLLSAHQQESRPP